jgi:dihydrofolate synthase/folylpolyglutamate synthase
LSSTVLPGRFQRLPGRVEYILDVAHNAQAMEYFVATLMTLPPVPKTHVVLGMLRTRDRASVMNRLSMVVDHWHLASLTARQGALASELAETWRGLARRGVADLHDSVAEAVRSAGVGAAPGDRVLIVGSFITVGEALAILRPDLS